MKLDVRLKGWKSDARIRRFVQEQLECLPNFGYVSDAQVVLVRAGNGGPAWTAKAHLAVPGPDLKAEGRDHTFEAAWRKVMDALHGQLADRAARRRHRSDERRKFRSPGRAA